ncbi:cupin-like domain-containing protein [Paraglaciecola polaris]|uniref:Transcription factor jumonji jmjC domain protein n=1 Tax=Paraglaciecola polaris LMG 21857 TaxID=1129793 RepID=K7AIP0_9ALTE|nr:cupin-like domain-containing protein [Paraglaciecola polaris]GAC35110.1 transcription factor jumonji jmjC domain protein [Paraglaciecola polaris LMG 21857]
MSLVEKSVKHITNCRPGDIPQFVLSSSEPLVLKGFANAWPIVEAGLDSPEQAANYLRSLYNGKPVFSAYGEPDTQGRVFYNDDMTGFNCQGVKADLNLVLDKLLAHRGDPTPPTIYVASADVNNWLPGFNQTNNAGMDEFNPLTNIWIGNHSRIAAHYDVPNNLACCVVGKRRYTVFPPEQIANLYVGPMELSPGGQDISLVDFSAPDYVKFPKFKQALQAAQVADLEPGDALFLPSMWWHHVEGLTDFNVLVTHWWRDSPAYFGRPENALKLAILSLRNLPPAQRDAWKAIFDHYIFAHQSGDLDHIPDAVKGMLSQPLDLLSAKKLRAELLNKLKV